MRDHAVLALEARFASYIDLISSVDDSALQRTIDLPKHKSLAQHLWCVVGARESYARAIHEGEWKGFNCSLTTTTQREISEKLESSAMLVMKTIKEVTTWTAERDRLFISLAEHEVMHEGQIIRHMYALEMDIPNSVEWA